MKKNRETIAPVVVKTGPVKDVIVRGDAVDQTEFPVPRWHYLEGGRYIHTLSGIVTRDPETRVMNVGIYRGMIGQKDTAPFLLIKGGQHWGAHFVKWAARKEPMPVACVIGWDPIMPFLSGSPIPAGVCEWDVMGAYRGEPAELVRCETVDLEVPAAAEIVIEGYISDDPATYETGRAVRRVHRLRLRRPHPAPDHEGDLHHPPPRPDLPRLPGGDAAGLLQREQRDVLRAARGHRLEHPERRGHPRHPRRVRAGHHQRGEHPRADQEALPGAAQADRRRPLGQQRRPVPLQARRRGGGRHRSRRRRAGGVGASRTG